MSAPPIAARQWLDRVVVDPSVLQVRPDYRAVVLVANSLNPGPSDDDTDALLATAEPAALSILGGRRPDELPEVEAWRDAYRSFGAKPQRTKPSVEALLRRIDVGLPRIDRITDIYNAVSVKHLLPVGGENVAAYRGAARLVRADGDESFDTRKDGELVVDHPLVGEVIWRDDLGVTCRCWNWRQCRRTRITHDTTTAVFILDGLEPGRDERLDSAASELRAHLGALHVHAEVAVRSFPSNEG